MSDTASQSTDAQLAKGASEAASIASTAPPPASDLEARLAAAEATIAKWGPMIESLLEVGARAADQNHSIPSILGAVAGQLLGLRL